jgi:hypothetical protein
VPGKRYAVHAAIALAAWLGGWVACSPGHPVTNDSGADSIGANVAVISCTSPADCEGVGATVYCCISNICTTTPPACTLANAQPIQAANYDQACSKDSDCVAVGEGNACLAGELDCFRAAINSGAYAQYKADVAKTNAAVCSAGSFCPNVGPLCCRNGMCQLSPCYGEGGSAAADASSE